eukprot:5320269-Lingulodinium_polyedra.AAC.1
MRGVVEFSFNVAGREALSRLRQATPTWGMPLAPHSQAATAQAGPAPADPATVGQARQPYSR